MFEKPTLPELSFAEQPTPVLNLALFLPLQSAKLTKELRCSKNTTEETFEERDIKLKELKDSKKAVNKMLLDVMGQHPDLQAILQTYFLQVKSCRAQMDDQWVEIACK